MPPSRLHQLRPNDPLVRWMVSPDGPADLTLGAALVEEGTCVAWMGRATRPGERWVTALGEDAAAVARLVVELGSRHEVDGVTVPDSAFGLLPAGLQSPDPGHWCLWTCDPATVSDEPAGARLLDLDDERIDPLLAHSDSAHVFAGNDRVVRWAGIEDGERLIAVAGLVRETSGAAHIVSVCTDPTDRGQGLAGRVCRHLMQSAVADGVPMIVLEMYVGNDAGRRVYERLGFVEVGRYLSGLLAHALPDRGQRT